MAKLQVVRASGVLILSAILFGCASAPGPQQANTTQAEHAKARQRVASRDRTPSWQKYQVSGSRIPRYLDASGRPLSADFVNSTTSEGLHMLPAVTMTPCSKSRSGC